MNEVLPGKVTAQQNPGRGALYSPPLNRSLLNWLLALGVVVTLASYCPTALAQMGGMGGGGMGGGPPAKSKPKPKAKAEDGVPELHAASGGSESTLPEGSEPELPADPTAISDQLREQIGTDSTIEQPQLGRGAETNRGFYGVYYHEESDRYKLKLAFPLWMEREAPSFKDPTQLDRASLFGGVYYNRRVYSPGGTDIAHDVLFPVFWNLREGSSRTTVVGPVVNRVTPTETDNWLAPLYFVGTRAKGAYQIIPPLLSYLKHDDQGGFNLIGGLGFCSWSGSSACFGENKTADLGVIPFYFSGHSQTSSYRLIPPLLHFHKEDSTLERTLDIYGPFYRESLAKRELFHVLPFYWSIWGKDERHTTLFPFFHYGWERNASLLVTPLFLNAKSNEGYETFATWGYARYRGRTELDMLTPLLWLYRDPDINLNQTLLFPFYYRRTSPREDSIAVFPFFGKFERFGISTDTWVTPFFRHTHDLTGWSTNIHPLAYFGRSGNESHAVVAPVFWDFAGPASRATVVAPVFWRFAKPDSLTQLVGNLLYTEQRLGRGTEWKIHVLPAFSYGETPDGHSWDVLFGLVGYKRQADFTQLKLFWLPITLSGTNPTP
jgi:hypothetical protein